MLHWVCLCVCAECDEANFFLYVCAMCVHTWWRWRWSQQKWRNLPVWLQIYSLLHAHNNIRSSNIDTDRSKFVLLFSKTTDNDLTSKHRWYLRCGSHCTIGVVISTTTFHLQQNLSEFHVYKIILVVCSAKHPSNFMYFSRKMSEGVILFSVFRRK